jgi:hypothetical protein
MRLDRNSDRMSGQTRRDRSEFKNRTEQQLFYRLGIAIGPLRLRSTRPSAPSPEAGREPDTVLAAAPAPSAAAPLSARDLEESVARPPRLAACAICPPRSASPAPPMAPPRVPRLPLRSPHNYTHAAHPSKLSPVGTHVPWRRFSRHTAGTQLNTHENPSIIHPVPHAHSIARIFRPGREHRPGSWRGSTRGCPRRPPPRSGP